MSFVFKRKRKNRTGLTTIKYYIAWTDPVTRKVCKVSTKKSNRKEADEFHRQWKEGPKVREVSILLSEFIQEVLKYVRLNLPATYYEYKRALSLLLEITGEKKLSLVSVSDIEYYKKVRLSSVGNRTVNKELSTIRAAFNKAQKNMKLIQEHNLSEITFLDKNEIQRREVIDEHDQILAFSLMEIVFYL